MGSAQGKGSQDSYESFIEGGMDQWWRKSNSIKVLISGRSGTGKSTMVNAIIGHQIAKVGDKLDPETAEVTLYETFIEDIKVIVWDTPGLQDGTNKEKAYLDDIECKCKGQIDLFLYCISMKNQRLMAGGIDIESICKLTERLGKEIWKNAAIVLTRANTRIKYMKADNMEKDEDELNQIFFKELDEVWKSQIRKCLMEDVNLPHAVVANLPILPAGVVEEPFLIRDSPPWLNSLWMDCLIATKRDAQPALMKMNIQRLKKSCDIRSNEEFKELLQKEKIIIYDKATEIGKMLKAEEAGRAVGQRAADRVCKSQTFNRRLSLDIPGVRGYGIIFYDNGEIAGLHYTLN